MADSDQPADGSGQATDTLLPRLDLVCEAKPQWPSLSRPTAELVFLPGSGSISAVRAGCRPASLRCQRLRAGSAWPSAGQWLSPSRQARASRWRSWPRLHHSSAIASELLGEPWSGPSPAAAAEPAVSVGGLLPLSHSGWSSAAGLRRPGRRLSVSSSPQPSVWLGACGPAVLEGWRGIRLLGRCQPCPRELSGRAAEAPVQAWPGVCGAAGRRQRGVDGGQQPSLGPGSGRAAAPVWPSGAGAASAGRAASQPPGGRESSGEQRLPTGGPRAESWRCWSERAPACSPGRVWAEQQAAVAGPAESQSHSLLAEQQIREREREREAN